MRSLIAVLVLMPSFAQAVSLRPQDVPSVIDGCIPGRPGPRPFPRPFPKPQPKPWDDASLDNLFTGSALKQKGSEAAVPVSAGDWTVEPRAEAGLSKFSPLTREARAIPLIERDGGAGAKIVKVGAVRDTAINLGATVISEGVKAASDAATKYAERDQTKESIEKYGGCRTKGTCSK